MPNFPGRRVYPNDGNVDMGQTVDSGLHTIHAPTGLARGGTTRDFNVTLRGLHERIDRRPRRPYP